MASTDPKITGLPFDQDSNWLHRGAGGGGQVLLATSYKTGFATVTATLNKLDAVKLKVRKAVAVDKLLSVVVNKATAGGLAVHGIYRDQGGGVQWPTTLITESFVGSMATDANDNAEISTAPSLILPAGDYWYAWKFGVAAPNVYGQNAYLLNSLDEIIGVKANTDVAAMIRMTETFQKSITGASKANPGVITAVGHGFSDNDRALIYSVGGMTQLNGNIYTVTVVDSDHFSIGVDTTGFTTYTSGGKVTRMPAIFPAATGNDYTSDYLMGMARPTA